MILFLTSFCGIVRRTCGGTPVPGHAPTYKAGDVMLLGKILARAGPRLHVRQLGHTFHAPTYKAVSKLWTENCSSRAMGCATRAGFIYLFIYFP